MGKRLANPRLPIHLLNSSNLPLHLYKLHLNSYSHNCHNFDIKEDLHILDEKGQAHECSRICQLPFRVVPSSSSL